MKTLIVILFVCPGLWGDGTPWGWWEMEMAWEITNHNIQITR
jgi:hypothetical protein